MLVQNKCSVRYHTPKSTRCLTSTETLRFIRDGEKRGRGYGGGGKREIIYLSLQTETTRMT